MNFIRMGRHSNKPETHYVISERQFNLDGVMCYLLLGTRDNKLNEVRYAQIRKEILKDFYIPLTNHEWINNQ